MKRDMPNLTRRDFLKLGGVGLGGLLAPGPLPGWGADPFPADLHGRVTSKTMWVYDRHHHQ
jgi:hypothetical protein